MACVSQACKYVQYASQACIAQACIAQACIAQACIAQACIAQAWGLGFVVGCVWG